MLTLLAVVCMSAGVYLSGVTMVRSFGGRVRRLVPAFRAVIVLLILLGLSPLLFQAGGSATPYMLTTRAEPTVVEPTLPDLLEPFLDEDVANERILSPEEEIREIARRTALRYGVDPALIQSMISVESSFDSSALSPKGAMGVMQLMPDTAQEMGVHDPYDVHQNIDGGVRYLKKLLRRYRGNIRLALAAYNAGPNKIRRHRGIPPYRETRKYVRKVISRYRKTKKRAVLSGI
ncbi:MAG: lytic transglycosylase domain-containing protein [Nitrospinota bacterium]